MYFQTLMIQTLAYIHNYVYRTFLCKPQTKFAVLLSVLEISQIEKSNKITNSNELYITYIFI